MYNSHSISFIKILIQFTFIISIKNKYLPIIILNNRNTSTNGKPRLIMFIFVQYRVYTHTRTYNLWHNIISQSLQKVFYCF